MTDMICEANEYCPRSGTIERCRPHEKNLLGCHRPCQLDGAIKPSKCIPYQPKEKPVGEYKVIRNFTPDGFRDSHYLDYEWTNIRRACDEFVSDYFWLIRATIDMRSSQYVTNSKLLVGLKTRTELKKHLLKYGFIEKVEPEVFYKPGDRFKLKTYEGCGNWLLWMDDLGSKKPKAALVGFCSGRNYSKIIEVGDSSKITEEEFRKITGGCPENFTKI